MSFLAPELREAPARVGMSTLIGVLNRRSLRSMCLYDVRSIRAGQPRMVGIGYTMRFISSRGGDQLLDDPAAGDGGMARRRGVTSKPGRQRGPAIARRAAAGVGRMARFRQVAALAASGIVAACAATYVVAPPPLVPAAARAPVAVLDHGRHSSLVVGLPDGRMVRYAYGDWRWYAEGTTGLAEGYAALFRETPGALGQRVLAGPLTAETLRRQIRVGIEDLLLLDVDAAAAQRLVDKLDGIAEAGRARMLTNQEVDLDFFPHPIPYTEAHSSNRVLAGWLREMGAEVEGDGLIADWKLRR